MLTLFQDEALVLESYPAKQCRRCHRHGHRCLLLAVKLFG